ncbi:hypothetical protein SCAR479_05260 [Seiridium cardinale]|uniref:EthD domain-containing protein n=1 Tax=Seiridium cardinale TaxID=138064 RepID=A0ABR2XVU0_9PEZI
MSESVITLGGPLFRHPDITHEEFSVAWRRHAQLVTPWFLHFGVKEYTQLHIYSSTSGQPVSFPASSFSGHIPPETLAQAQKTLRQADAFVMVRCVPNMTSTGGARPLGDGMLHSYFKKVIAIDERRFLHFESGATAVVPENGKPEFEVPQLDADVWKALVAESDDLVVEELVAIKDGEVVMERDQQWWDQWQTLNNYADGDTGRDTSA